jgi:hypothetical protein
MLGMPTLREFIADRRTEVQAQIKALRAEMAELDTALRALDDVAHKGRGPDTRERGSENSGKKTLKEMALEVLREHPTGLDANAIRDAINARFDVGLTRESLSPQLSRLGQEEKLVRAGYIWRVATDADRRAREVAALEVSLLNPMRAVEPQQDETPDGQTSGASEPEEDRMAELLR